MIIKYRLLSVEEMYPNAPKDYGAHIPNEYLIDADTQFIDEKGEIFFSDPAFPIAWFYLKVKKWSNRIFPSNFDWDGDDMGYLVKIRFEELPNQITVTFEQEDEPSLERHFEKAKFDKNIEGFIRSIPHEVKNVYNRSI